MYDVLNENCPFNYILRKCSHCTSEGYPHYHRCRRLQGFELPYWLPFESAHSKMHRFNEQEGNVVVSSLTPYVQ